MDKVTQAHKKIRKLQAKRVAITKEIVATFNKVHPIGSTVHFRKWRGDITAEVISHSPYYESICVLTTGGKTLRVDFSWILDSDALYHLI